MTLPERIIRWAANYFIFSAVFLIVASVFPIFDGWLRLHRVTYYPSSAERFGSIVGFIAGRFLHDYWFLILMLVNGLVLRRYKSRVAAGLFILFGLLLVGLNLFALRENGFNSTLAVELGFFGLYLVVAVWTLITLIGFRRAHE